MEKVEFLILRSLLYNEEFLRKTLPFLKKEYFEDFNQRVVFEEIASFTEQYNEPITKEALSIEIQKRSDFNDSVYKEISHLISCLDDVTVEQNWLVDTTEKWCRDRAIYLALMDSIQIADGQDEKRNRDAIPSILSDALAVSFDNNVGHDYLQDYEVSGTNPTTRRRIVSRLILNTLTRLQKVVFLTRLSISLLLVQASVSLCLCAI